MLDRIDINIRMGAVDEAEFGADADKRVCMDTEQMRKAVLAARKRGALRNPEGIPNSRLSAEGMRIVCEMERDAEDLLRKAYEHYSFSVRVRSKLIKVARTIADISGSGSIIAEHMAEAIAYRGVN